MLPVSNYRISVKKNISLKTIAHFHPIHNPAGNPNSIPSRVHPKLHSKKSLQSLNSHLSQKSTDKTFAFDSSDQFIKRILLANGWQLLPNDFAQVKLKWQAIPKPLQSCPEPNQLMNHFKDSYKLTTKLGLYNLLSSPHQEQLTDKNGKNYTTYFPRSYDLGSEFQPFCHDFTHTAVLNLMKKLMIHVQIIHEATLYNQYKHICQKLQFKNTEEKLINEIQISLANKHLIFQTQSHQERVLVNKTIFLHLLNYWKLVFDGNLKHKIHSPLTQSLTAFSKLNPPFNKPNIHFSKQSDIAFLTHSSALLFFKLYFYCIQTNPNFLNDGLSNIWIIKSNESSRGRNIFLIDDIEQVHSHKNGANKLIQKYIENVWILNSGNLDEQILPQKIYKILNKKFDTRFWVLVNSFAPLDAYIFSEGYLRLSSQTYNFLSNESLQKNLRTHLTNFSVNFLPFLKNQRQTADKSECDQDNSYLLFSDFLSFIQGKQKMNRSEVENSELFNKIVTKISHILEMASVNWRRCEWDKNSFELFGFDVIFDSELEPYVLECNMSPACHERGELKALVEDMGEGLLEKIGLINRRSGEELTTAKRGWIKLNQGPLWQQAQTGEGKSKANHQDLLIVGQFQPVKYIMGRDWVINLVQKITYLQRFFKKRYGKEGQNPVVSKSVSASCSIIEVLARVAKRRQHIWRKKAIKYMKRLSKKKLATQNLESINSTIRLSQSTNHPKKQSQAGQL